MGSVTIKEIKALHDIEAKIQMVRETKNDLDRLEQALKNDHVRIAKSLQEGGYGGRYITDTEVEAQVKRAKELERKWSRP